VKYRRNLLALCIGCALIQAGDIIVGSFLPILLLEFGTSANASFWSGAVFSVAALTSAIMAPVWGALSDRYGKRPMLIRAGTVLAIAYALMGFATNHVQILWLKAFTGALAGYIPAATMLIATTTPNEDLGFAMGLLQTTMAVGTIAGPILGAAYVSLFGLNGAYVACAALPAIAMFIAVFIVKEETIQKTKRTGIIRGMRQTMSLPVLQILFGVLVIMQAGTICIRPTLPLLIKELTPANAALATSAIAMLFGVATAISAPLVGRYWRGNYVAMLRDSLLFLVVFVMLQGFSKSVYSLGVFRFISGAPSVAMSVAINVLVAQAVAPEVRGTVFGVMNAMSSVGSVLGPLLGGYLGSVFGVASSFFGAAILYGCSGMIVIFSYKFLMDTLRDTMEIQPPSTTRGRLLRRGTPRSM
jgi:DHA1 family multidrug resistance protein-like MFS transporter